MSLLIKPKIKNKCRVCTKQIDYPFNVHESCIDNLLGKKK
uniref:ORF37 n=1 Tax=Nitrosopumilaceae spindle-shaped virus TaxID=3065433 RepID=A0AAT9JB20_9VIRU